MADSPSGSRPSLRTGGIALLGVGVVAAAIGLFTSATGGNGAGTAVPSASAVALPPSASAPAPVSPAPVATAPAQPKPTAAATPAPASEPPAIAAPPRSAANNGEGGGDQSTRAPLRVYNNSLIKGLAARAESDFEGAGWTVTSADNYSASDIPTSTAYYRPGTDEEVAARNLADAFGLHVAPRFAGLDEASPGVIVIVTNDYGHGGKS